MVFTVACFYPGYMSQDSVSQLLQGRALTFTAWHPPVMSLLWGLLDRVAPGPAGMLILQNLVFWGGLSLFVYGLGFQRGWAAVAVLLVGLFPPVFALLSTIWKDVGMACSFLLACGLLLRAERERSRVAWMLAVVALWYGLSVRHNAIIAVVPLAIWAALVSQPLFRTAPERSPRSAARRAALLVAFLGVTAFGANRFLVKQDSPQPVQQILIHDLVGVSLGANRLLLPEYLAEALGSAEVSALKPLYTPNEIVPLFCHDHFPGCFPLVSDPDKISRLWAVWRSAVSRHPGAYLRHRRRVFESEFGIGTPTVCLPIWDGIILNSLNVSFHPTKLNRSVMSVLSAVMDGPLFRGWLYLVLLAGLLILFWRRASPHRTPALLIGLSGLLYGVAYFFVSTTCDFRMHWWTVLSVFLLALLTVHGEGRRVVFPHRR